MTNVNNLPPVNGRLWEIVTKESAGNFTDFAKPLGVSSQKIRRLFREDKRNGKYIEPGIDLVKIIAQIYGVSINWIITSEKSPYDDMDSKTQISSKTNIPKDDCCSKSKEELEAELKEARADVKHYRKQVDKLSNELLKSKDLNIELLSNKSK